MWWVYSTFPNKEEALSVCGKLLEERLIACANLLPEMTAVYRWQG
ncbi:MAG: divalent-cation tolerance protein CutA, partial [Proteobacteria bacterium]|nr:divalent-cation tolerance protein CutA [Pseudomonadota bacterium]